jgi:hypothetical protein
MNLFSKACEKECVRVGVYERKGSKEELLISSEETVDAWASRETSVSLAFFERLGFRA